MPQLFTNNATSTLAGGISDSALSLTVESGHGARFPNPGAGEWFVVTLEKSDGTREIVKVTARATDTFTIERAQEGTTAVAFSAGDVVELRVTAETLSAIAAGIYAGALREIASVTTTGSQSSVTFSSIPGTYRDLKIVLFARGDLSATAVAMGVQCNGDTGANYDFVRESRFGVASGFAATRSDLSAIVAATAVAGAYTYCELDIPGYALTGPHKMFTSRHPIKQANAVGNVFNELGEGFWRNGDPITQLTVALASGAFVDGSKVTLYGIGGEPSVIVGETASDTVNTEQSTSSTSFTDLATAGPSVTLVTGTEVLVTISAYAYTSSAGPYAYISVDVSGATTIAANATNQQSARSPGDAYVLPLCRTFKITGLTPGANTFTLKYRVNTSSFNFGNRDITVRAL